MGGPTHITPSGQPIFVEPVEADGTPRVVISASGRTYVHGVALAASYVLKNSPGSLYMVEAKLDASAPAGTYYALLLDAASLPANGVVTIHEAIPITHGNGVDDLISFPIKNGIPLTAGAVLALSSTVAASTLTISGAYLWLFGAEVGP
jgi:hypothetical protein